MAWKYIPIIMKLFPLIVEFVGYAEEIYRDYAKFGSVKKNAVFRMLEFFIESMVETSTGGQLDTWKEVQAVWDVMQETVSAAIDSVVSWMNALGWD